jgi:hypothetical protein
MVSELGGYRLDFDFESQEVFPFFVRKRGRMKGRGRPGLGGAVSRPATGGRRLAESKLRPYNDES